MPAAEFFFNIFRSTNAMDLKISDFKDKRIKHICAKFQVIILITWVIMLKYCTQGEKYRQNACKITKTLTSYIF